jgi:hypothetical protein
LANVATVAGVKLCSTCGEANEFGKNVSQPDGLQNECKPCRRKRNKKIYKQSPEYRYKSWASRIMREYGWTVERYYETLAAQGGGCAICGSRNPGRGNARFSIDHNHVSGLTRALLCHSCNVALGLLKEDKSRIQKMIDYLTDWE